MAIALCLKCNEEVHWKAGRGAKIVDLRHSEGRSACYKDYVQDDFCKGELKGGSIKAIRTQLGTLEKCVKCGYEGVTLYGNDICWECFKHAEVPLD